MLRCLQIKTTYATLLQVAAFAYCKRSLYHHGEFTN